MANQEAVKESTDFYAEYERVVSEAFVEPPLPPTAEWAGLTREQTFPFLKAHYASFAQAQRWIFAQLVELERSDEGDRDEINHRRLLIRRLADYLAVHMVGGHPEILESLTRDDTIHGVQIDVVKEALEQAEAQNRADPLGFALVTDLTTCIQVADLFYVNYGEKPQTALIELKAGETNRKLIDYVQEPEERLACMYRLSRECTRAEISQIVRMLKQGVNIATAGAAYDSASAQHMERPFYSLDHWDSLHYGDLLNELCSSAKDKGGAMAHIERCLFLGLGYSSDPARASENASIGLKRVLEMGDGVNLGRGAPPMPVLPAAIRTEVEQRWKVRKPSKFFDPFAANLRAMGGFPFQIWPLDHSHIMDLARRHLRISAAFDVRRFLWLARDHGFDVRLAGRQQSAKSKVEKTDGTIWTWGNRSLVIDGRPLWPRFFHWIAGDLIGPMGALHENEYRWVASRSPAFEENGDGSDRDDDVHDRDPDI